MLFLFQTALVLHIEKRY